ncbi:hypothetical protein [Inquilinus limosus]|uniref:Uncharacterized protein n=1 Tax=Inquilinus limosus MP06 TaxID=1398085 RepID=A0A0A0D7N2_9PROT|nr:hypothetical protein [Inquilinus limosus]KGM34691.1 hypothetical protein P409_08820 [Inquilinus limosus MP06]
MAYNLFIAYDLLSPGQNYDAVRNRIRELGPNWQFQLSLFYVHSGVDPQNAYAHVLAVMDANDKLAVINAADYLGAIVTNWDHPPINEINAIWTAP